MTTTATKQQHTERPWHRRSVLWAHEAEIRRLRAEGYSLRQIVDRLGLAVHRSTLHRWLRRADAAAGAARPACEPAASASPAAPGAVESAEAAAEDAAALAVLDSSGFTPPTTRALK